MKVAIFGCRDGEYLYQQIEQNGKEKYQVCCFCDNASKYLNTLIAGIPVLGFDRMVQKYRKREIEAIIVAVRKGYSRYCIIEQLKKEGIDNIVLLKPGPLTYHLPIVFDENETGYRRQWMFLKEQKLPVIHHLEAHAADGCNLNCKGCLHFANLYDRGELPDLRKLLEDIRRVEENCEIFQFRILGGEPLLNPELPQFLSKLRGVLPDTDIAVISNGILIPKVPKELFEVMRDAGIGFNLTLYPPTLKMKERIYSTLDEYHVAYGSHEAKTDEFEKYMMLYPAEEDTHAYESCVSRGILTLCDGKLYKCPIVAYVNRYFDTFGLRQHYEEGVNIYDDRLNWQALIEKLTLREGAFCRHCTKKSEPFQWSVGKPKYDDWLVSEG
ncbi:MAG: radical SAM protein [Lachnospiraceae bacterium]|nr:radical SAM protein [Lachnospiraceae bacterium]